MAAKSPLMEQYKSVKNEYKDALLFYRLGDFYELFMMMQRQFLMN